MDVAALENDLAAMMQGHGAALWGFADVAGLGPGSTAAFPRAVSFAFAMDPAIMAGLHHGPTPEYAVLYKERNQAINRLAGELAQRLAQEGFQSFAVDASLRSDPVNIRGDFPHKTAATRAGLGWVGRHCQVVSKELGPWLRLGTVLTHAPLRPGRAIEASRCGKCRACVDACPAGALAGGQWRAGVGREVLLDAAACDAYKKKHFQAHHGGHNCGICTSACPVGQKLLVKQ